MSNTITILLGEEPLRTNDEATGFRSLGEWRSKLELDPQQFVDILAPIMEVLEKVSAAGTGPFKVWEAELCIGVDVNGNIGIRPLGGVEAGIKTALKVVVRRDSQKPSSAVGAES